MDGFPPDRSAVVVKACHAQGANRLVYVTSLGIAADSAGTRARGRWAAEESLFQSGLNVTVVRPGQIVGRGGQGFEMLLAQAKKPLALVLGKTHNRLRAIAIDDLVEAMVGVLDEPRTYGLRLELGSNDVLRKDEMIDIIAEVLGRRPPWKVHVPVGLLRAAAPLLERATKAPRGAVGAIAEALDANPKATSSHPNPKNVMPAPTNAG